MSNDMGQLVSELQDVLDDQSAQLDRLQEAVDEQNCRLHMLVPKSRFWWTVGVLSVSFVVAAIILLMVRQNDLEARERARSNSIAACERVNDLRITFREAITIAYQPRPVPPDLPPDLAEAFRLQQADREARRDALLSRKGMQMVDCTALYPK